MHKKKQAKGKQKQLEISDVQPIHAPLNLEGVSNALHDYQSIFSPLYNNEELLFVKIGESYDELERLILNATTNRSTSNFIVYGYPGFGRKTGVRYAIHKLNQQGINIHLIKLDGYIHSSEGEFCVGLISQLKNLGLLKSRLTMRDIMDDQISFKEIETALEDLEGFCVLMIDQIDMLASLKRQTMLYSILDWIQSTRSKVIMIGVTSILKFTDNLEKRVRSRLSSDSVYFFSYEMQSLCELISQRINYNRESPNMNEIMLNALKSKIITKFIEDKVYAPQKSIEWTLQLIKVAFCWLSPPDVLNLVEPLQQDLINQQFLEALQKSYSFLIPQRELQLAQDLNHSELLVLSTIYSMIKNQIPLITLNTVLQEINEHKKRLLKTHQVMGTSINLSPLILEKALENLVKLKIILLDENKQEGNDNRALILCLTMEEMSQLVSENNQKWPLFLQQIISY